jgi:hypothetical protein
MLPTTFNVENNVVAPFNLVVDATFNDELHETTLLNLVNPLTLNDDTQVVTPFNLVVPDTFNDELHVAIPFNVVVPDTFNDDNNVDAPETNKLVKFVLFNNVVDVLFKLLIDNIDDVDKLLTFVVNANTGTALDIPVIVVVVD